MSLFGNLLSATLGVVETPISLLKDVATFGGTLTDEDEPYTVQKLEEISDDYERFKKDLRN